MSDDDFDGARWIARPVSASQRIVRQITADRVDWAEPGHSLGQSFHAEGPVTAVNFDLVPRLEGAAAHDLDVAFTIALHTPDGGVIAERRFEGPQLVWDYFGPLLDVDPPAPPGDYVAVLSVDRETIGWSTADAAPGAPDDGISPLPVDGVALADGQPAGGVRMLGVDTVPAPNPVFRRTFELGTAPDTATIAATVLGTGIIRINGQRVGDEALEPAVTDYDKTVLYRV